MRVHLHDLCECYKVQYTVNWLCQIAQISTERGIKLLVNPFRIHQKQNKLRMKCLLLWRCKLHAEAISLLGNASGFNQNFLEYKSHFIIEYFRCMNISSSMNIRYSNERDNLYIHYIANNKHIRDTIYDVYRMQRARMKSHRTAIVL